MLQNEILKHIMNLKTEFLEICLNKKTLLLGLVDLFYEFYFTFSVDPMIDEIIARVGLTFDIIRTLRIISDPDFGYLRF